MVEWPACPLSTCRPDRAHHRTGRRGPPPRRRGGQRGRGRGTVRADPAVASPQRASSTDGGDAPSGRVRHYLGYAGRPARVRPGRRGRPRRVGGARRRPGAPPGGRRRGAVGGRVERPPAGAGRAHGNLPAARAFAAGLGLSPVRKLHKMARRSGRRTPTPRPLRCPRGSPPAPSSPGRTTRHGSRPTPRPSPATRSRAG